jgi:inner membrane transporter RhtA
MTSIAATGSARTVTGVGMAVASMTSVQLGLALSIDLAATIGPSATAWLRLVVAGAVLLVVTRPWRVRWDRRSFAVCAVLGLCTGMMTVLFMVAATRLPLGTASALEFLGPLGVSLWKGSRSARWWALCAAAGLALLTQPWSGGADLLGVVLALVSGACWAGYIVITEHVSGTHDGMAPLGVSLPVAAITATIVVVPTGVPAIPVSLLPVVLLTAVLVPLLPFALEFSALRRLPTSTFSTLMSVEPAIAATFGFLILGQHLRAAELVGIGLVVVASIMTERANRPATLPLPA